MKPSKRGFGNLRKNILNICLPLTNWVVTKTLSQIGFTLKKVNVYVCTQAHENQGARPKQKISYFLSSNRQKRSLPLLKRSNSQLFNGGSFLDKKLLAFLDLYTRIGFRALTILDLCSVSMSNKKMQFGLIFSGDIQYVMSFFKPL